MLNVSIMLVSVIALAAPVAAQTGPAAEVPAKPAEKLICHTDDTLGSRVRPQKTCMTAKQWRESSQDASDWLERRTQLIGKPGGG